MTSEHQGSFPYLTVACVSLIAMNLAVFPIDYGWRRLFPEFATLPKHIRRHDANLLMRAVMGPILGVVFVYVSVKTWQDVNYFFDERTFISCCVVSFLMLDIFDLSQKRRFEWHPYVHHIVQTVYTLYFLEWGADTEYNRSFPNMGLILFSLSHKPMLGLFPLRRVAKTDEEKVCIFAKFAFADIVFAIIVGLGSMLALIIKHREHLPLSAMIIQPIFFLFFNAIDIPFYTFIYKIAYGKPKVKKVEAENEEHVEQPEATAAVPNRRTSRISARVSTLVGPRITARVSSLAIEMGEVMDNPRNSVFGMPFFDDDAIDEGGDSNSVLVLTEHEA